jgi:molybdopterin/thiamine biosynthesis adenylyltransferase
MDDTTLLRYSRHLLLEEIGIAGQERFRRAGVLLIGAGGLGSPAASYLVAAGIGRLVLLDHDQVDLTNLQRQVLHTTERIGQPKAASAAQSLRALNPDVQIDARVERATAQNLGALVAAVDVVVDCSDNRATRYALNRACVAARRPLVSAAASALAGQLAVFDLRRDDAPCYACLFPEGPGSDESCATTGVFAPLTGILGALQAAETLRLIHPFGSPATGRLLTVDGADMDFSRLGFARDPHCPVCAQRPAPGAG